jgi:hypothetical protein
MKRTHTMQNPLKSIEKAIRSRIDVEISKRGKTLVRKQSLSWLVEQITGSSMDFEKYELTPILNDYRFEKLRPDDIVLDIGAGGGLYSLLAASIVRKVFFQEPIISEEMWANIEQSKFHFVPFEHIAGAFGANGQKISCEYWDYTVEADCIGLQHILDNNPEITVLKCDCESGEWEGILPCEDFKKLRMMDIEYHLQDGRTEKDLFSMIAHLEDCGFEVSIIKRGFQGMIYADREI